MRMNNAEAHCGTSDPDTFDISVYPTVQANVSAHFLLMINVVAISHIRSDIMFDVELR